MNIPVWVAVLVLTPMISLIAYFIRMTTLDAINQLRGSAEKQGKRLGAIDKALAILVHEAEKDGRVRRKTLHEMNKDDEDDSDGGGTVRG
jgi:hypothetical protein